MRSVKIKISISALFLLGLFFVHANAQSGDCGTTFLDYDISPLMSDEVLVYANYTGGTPPALVDVLQPGETLNLSIVSGQNTFLGGTQVIENLVFITICRSAALQGSTQVCQGFGGAGALCSDIFECQNDFHVWTPPSVTAAVCNNIQITLPHQFAPVADVVINISYVIVTPSCPDTLLLTQNLIPSDLYEASSAIIASGSISDNGLTEMKAGESVILRPGFQALLGRNVRMFIGECTPPIQPAIPETGHSIDLVSDLLQLDIQPNPVNGEAIIRYQVPEPSPLTLALYDLSGNLIHTIYEEKLALPGDFRVNWHPSGLSSGVYLIVLTTDKGRAVRRVVAME